MQTLFESFANSKRYKTLWMPISLVPLFESFANSKRYKTPRTNCIIRMGLRALLIQKDTKLSISPIRMLERLRALLIQKDTKLSPPFCYLRRCLRALLIQKDTKLNL